MKSTLLEKSFRILDKVASSPEPVTLKELAADLELNTSTASRIAADLVARNLIRKSGYHSFVPAAGLIRLGQAALDTPLVRNARSLIAQRLTEVKANALFCAMDQGHLVPLCREEREKSDPFNLPLWNSHLAAVILSKQNRPEWIRVFFEDTFTGAERSTNREQDFDRFNQLCQQAAKEGCLIFKNPRFGWSASFPVPAAGQVFGLTFYGEDVDSCNMELMRFECNRLASKLASSFNTPA